MDIILYFIQKELDIENKIDDAVKNISKHSIFCAIVENYQYDKILTNKRKGKLL